MEKKKGKITGIGGVFFKSKDPAAMREWYNNNFGMTSDQYGMPFTWRKPENPDKKGYTMWNAFDDKSDYFDPSKQKYMINYRVENLEELIKDLKEQGATIVGEILKEDYGSFAWVLDPEGNKIELWEPVDETFDDHYGNE
jgi:predicted enzyme related to lactoylglutathione lyase